MQAVIGPQGRLSKSMANVTINIQIFVYKIISIITDQSSLFLYLSLFMSSDQWLIPLYVSHGYSHSIYKRFEGFLKDCHIFSALAVT